MAEKESGYRRRIVLYAHEGMVRAGLEDDFHHHEVAVRHDGKRVTAIEGEAIRTPWSSCAGAKALLALLVGAPITADIQEVAGLPRASEQCTHWHDLALLAIAQAARGGRRQYDVLVRDRSGRKDEAQLGADGKVTGTPRIGGRTRVDVRRDGELVVSWDMEGEEILDPPPYAGWNVRGVLKGVKARCDADTVEAVRVLRRGIQVSGARGLQLARPHRAAEHPALVLGACYAYQESRIQEATRNPDTERDFSAAPEALLASFKI